MSTQIQSDRALIEGLGNTKAVAEMIGCSHNRVSNWKKRGIPARIKVQYPNLFMPQIANEKR